MMQSGQRDGWRALAAGRRRRRGVELWQSRGTLGSRGSLRVQPTDSNCRHFCSGLPTIALQNIWLLSSWVHRRCCADFLLRLPSLSPARLQIEHCSLGFFNSGSLLPCFFDCRVAESFIFWNEGIVHSELVFYPFATLCFVGRSMYVGNGDTLSSTQLGTLAGKNSTLWTQSGVPGWTK